MNYKYPPDSKPLPGYTIRRGVGRGAFGEVYYAVSDGGKDVALKLVQNQVEVELRGVRECLNLQHANLVRLYDVQQNDQGESWVVMEYCGGESLEEAIARYPDGMPIDVALQWMRGLCSAVAFLHEKDIVHRDLKPSHVYMEDGVVKVGDYGLAKFVTVSRRSGNTEGIGTVFYAAPEMAQGRYGKEIDLYALGVMFYEMLSGDVPFDGQSAAEVLMKHLTAQPDLSRFPSPYREIIGKLLQKKPERRFRSVAELVAALDAPLLAAAPSDGSWPGRFANLAGRLRVRQRAWGIVRAMWRHKAATGGVAILLCVAAGIGIAIGDANRAAWNRRYYFDYEQYRSPRLSSLSRTQVKRHDATGTTVQLGQIAMFVPSEFAERDPRRRFTSRYRLTRILPNPGMMKSMAVTENDILEGLWDAGFCPVIDIHVKSADAAKRGIAVGDVVRALNRLNERNSFRRREVQIRVQGNRILVRFIRLRGREHPQGSVAFYLMDPIAYLNVECSPSKGGEKVALPEIADVEIGAGDVVIR